MNPLGLAHAPVLLCDFGQRSLEDHSGNGLYLAGTHSFREVSPQVWELAPGSDVSRPSYDAALALTGDMTLEVTGTFYAAPSAAIFASFTASGETTATNTLWLGGAHSATQLRWLHEHGSTGTDDQLLSTNAPEALPGPGCDFHVAWVRSGGVVQAYLNRRPWGAPSAAFPAPTGGTSAALRVMFGNSAFGLRSLKVIPSALTRAQVEAEYDIVFPDPPAALPLAKVWLGALTDTSVTIVRREVTGVTVRQELTGLEPDTLHSVDGVAFRTLPEAGTPCDFTVAFGGDANTGSTHAVFNRILLAEPRMFIHLGDLNYENVTPNSEAPYHAALDAVFASIPQHRLYRSVPTQWVWDDHDGSGGGNGDGTAIGWPAAAAVYRDRVPHYPLPHSRAIYQTWDIGRVRFIMTDQRSEAVAGVTILGAAQKAWFKDLIANSPGMLIVWICPRWFCNANHADSWNSYAAERTELADHIKANAHGRVVVLEADQHTLAIDDGSHADYATGGGEPLRCFRAAPLDRTPSALANTYSHGEFNGNGQFGTMQVEDAGLGSIDVTWTGYDSAGSVLTTYSFSVAV